MRICPTCGERCAQAWCGFCERALPGCCALGTCTDPTCDLCVRLKQRFPPVVRCPHTVGVGTRDRRVLCRFVAGHPGPCRPSSRRVVVDEVDERQWWTSETTE